MRLVLSVSRALTLAVLSGSIASVSAVTQSPFDCPMHIRLTDQSLATVPEGWEATTSGSERTQHDLVGFAVNGGRVGSPNGEIYDKEEERKDGKGGATRMQRWNLQGMSGGFAVCSYFRTRVELARSLDGYSSCEVTYKRSKNSDFKIASASCR